VKIYLASSWRNAAQAAVLQALRNEGHMVYDFKNPKEGDDGFDWKQVGMTVAADGTVTPHELEQGLTHPRAVDGFQNDFGAMQWSDACVLLLPCGRSAHLEAGWMAGAGKPVFVLAPENVAARIEPELMYKLLGPRIYLSAERLLKPVIYLSVEQLIVTLYDLEYTKENLKYGGYSMFDLHDNAISVQYIFEDQEVAISLSKRPLPRVGDGVEIGLTVYTVASVIHRLSQHEPKIRVFLTLPRL
jgi:hypothetical protein